MEHLGKIPNLRGMWGTLSDKPVNYQELAARRAAEYNSRPGDLDDGYDCPECLNRGYFEDPPGTMKPCRCMPIRKSLRRLKQLGLDRAAKRLTFENFRTEQPWQKTALDLARSFSQEEAPGWMLLCGQSGCGKTHLCTAAAVALLYRGYELRYMRWADESSRLKTLGLDTARGDILSDFAKAPLLYIDDFWKATPTEADKHIAFELINERYNNDCITIISSERSCDDLLDIDEAVGGRIFERCGRYQLFIARDRKRNYRIRSNAEV